MSRPPPVEEKKEEESGNAAWDLSRKLKARMNALHGKGGGKKKSIVIESRKSNFKREMKLADSDETPDEFDPDDSDYDDDSDADSSSS